MRTTIMTISKITKDDGSKLFVVSLPAKSDQSFLFWYEVCDFILSLRPPK